MHEDTLNEIVNELDELLPGRFLGRIFQLSSLSLALDFGLKGKGFLFISVEPGMPRLYLIKRAVRELVRASIPPSPFAQAMRVALSGGAIQSLVKDENERVVRFSFLAENDLGDSSNHVLIAQLTGRSANLFLLDANGKIQQALRNPQGDGQQVGELYKAPSYARAASARTLKPDSETQLSRENATTFSAAADKYYSELGRQEEFDSLARSLQSRLRKEISRRKKLQANLRQDLVTHGNPEAHKKVGDLLLANLASASRFGGKVSLTDYYAKGSPTIEVEVDENVTLQAAASASFTRYTKAKRAVAEIGVRLVQLEQELEALGAKLVRLENAIAHRDASALTEFEEKKSGPGTASKKQKASPTLPGMRRYRSTDGYEVIVGRTAKDNDRLTFRVARPNDLWLHAGDYPGSHVIVRNSSRNDIPHRTIIEAAQLAAKFSQANKDSKVNIHYTRRKFLTKPKGAAPGLVRMSSFKTITVEPGENLERVK